MSRKRTASPHGRRGVVGEQDDRQRRIATGGGRVAHDQRPCTSPRRRAGAGRSPSPRGRRIPPRRPRPRRRRSRARSRSRSWSRPGTDRRHARVTEDPGVADCLGEQRPAPARRPVRGEAHVVAGRRRVRRPALAMRSCAVGPVASGRASITGVPVSVSAVESSTGPSLPASPATSPPVSSPTERARTRPASRDLPLRSRGGRAVAFRSRRARAAPRPPCLQPALVEGVGVVRPLRADIDRARPPPDRRDEPGRRIHRAAAADGHEERAASQGPRDDIHAERQPLAEPHDVGPEAGAAAAGRGWSSWATRSPKGGRAHASQRLRKSSPCMWCTRVEPAFSCRSSTFWVQRKRRSPIARSSAARARVGRVGLAGRRPARAFGRRSATRPPGAPPSPPAKRPPRSGTSPRGRSNRGRSRCRSRR